MVSCGGAAAIPGRQQSMGKSAVSMWLTGQCGATFGRWLASPAQGLSGATTRTRYWSPSSAWHGDGWWACCVGGAGHDPRHVGSGLVQTGQLAGISDAQVCCWWAGGPRRLSHACHKSCETWWDGGRCAETISAALPAPVPTPRRSATADSVLQQRDNPNRSRQRRRLGSAPYGAPQDNWSDRPFAPSAKDRRVKSALHRGTCGCVTAEVDYQVPSAAGEPRGCR
jgi:hypothetical protein